MHGHDREFTSTAATPASRGGVRGAVERVAEHGEDRASDDHADLAPWTRLEPVANPATTNTTRSTPPGPARAARCRAPCRPAVARADRGQQHLDHPAGFLLADAHRDLLPVHGDQDEDDDHGDQAGQAGRQRLLGRLEAAHRQGDAVGHRGGCARHGIWTSRESPASCASVAVEPVTPPSGSCLMRISWPGTRTALRSPLRNAASPPPLSARRPRPPGRRPPAGRGDKAADRRCRAADDPDVVRPFLPARAAGSATARATAINMIAVVMMKTRVLTRSRSSRRATSQVIANALLFLASSRSRRCPRGARGRCVLGFGLADGRPGRLAEDLGQRPVLVREVLHGLAARARSRMACESAAGAMEISAVPSVRTDSTVPVDELRSADQAAVRSPATRTASRGRSPRRRSVTAPDTTSRPR